jgi:hypothetical protein
MFCMCVGKGKPLICVLGNCSNKDHATCEWDHLWNDGLQIKLTLIFTLVIITSFKLFILLSIRCVVHLSHVMPKLKRDDNFIGLIWISKVCYAMALKMFGRAKIGQDLHLKGKWKGDCLTYELPWIGDDSWLVSSITFNFHFKFAFCFKHVFSKLYSLVCVYVHFKIWGTTKEAFVVNLMKIILTNW